MATDLLETVLDLAARDPRTIPAQAREMARLSLYDWILCGLAGKDEPVAAYIHRLAESEGGVKLASAISGGLFPPRMAALVNGTISHALDFDDTHFGHLAHVSVAVYPAALAAAEETDASLDEMIDAYVLGAEAAIRVGMTLGMDHYDRGFHQTATSGAFGATVAAARLYGLDREQTRTALGLCATRASGLKSQFGTMGKPYNAGIAASNGIEVAKLARLGFSGPFDGLTGAQGFVPTHSSAPKQAPGPSDRFLFEDIRYKFHACCHGTHAMLEALLIAMKGRNLNLRDIAACKIRTSPRWMSVCNTPTPQTGLEVKFSYRWLAGIVLDGRPTGSIALYADELAEDPALIAFAEHVEVIPDDAVGYMQAECMLELADGTRIETHFDLETPIVPKDVEARLRKKARDMFGDAAAGFDRVLDAHGSMTASDVGAILREGTHG